MDKIEGLEELLSAVFSELELKAAFRELVRTLVKASKGEKVFELSLTELGDLLYRTNSLDDRGVKRKARDSFRSFQKWQREKNVCLVKVIKIGKQVRNADGTFSFEKTLYESALVEELVKVSQQERTTELTEVVEGILRNIRSRRVTQKKKKAYHPNHQIKKAKKTILTLILKIYDLALHAEKDALGECLKVLRLAENKVTGMHEKQEKNHKNEEYISKFEKKLEISTRGEN